MLNTPPALLRATLWATWLLTSGAVLASDRGGPTASGEFAVRPLNGAPKLAWETRAGFRDWGKLGLDKGLVLAGHINDDGGVRALDLQTGKIHWLAEKGGKISETPVSDGKLIVVSSLSPGYVAAVSLAGKQIWRLPLELVYDAQPTLVDGQLYVQAKDGYFYALDPQTGAQRWRFQFSPDRSSRCASQPLVADGTVYFTSAAEDSFTQYHLWALDAVNGEQRWRYQQHQPDSRSGSCIRQPVLIGDSLYAATDMYLLAVDRANGRERWFTEVNATIDGKPARDPVHGLVVAGGSLYGMTERYLAEFDPRSGQTTWRLPGRYRVASPSMAVAGNTLYFQGTPGAGPNDKDSGTLHALDFASKRTLWSYTHPRILNNWSFGDILPVEGGVIVPTMGAVLRLQTP